MLEVCPGVHSTGRVAILEPTLVKSTSYCPVASFRVEVVEVFQRKQEFIVPVELILAQAFTIPFPLSLFVIVPLLPSRSIA